jgi:hypothetical protein
MPDLVISAQNSALYRGQMADRTWYGTAVQWLQLTYYVNWRKEQ